MNLTGELVKIRRALRDPTGNIWDTDLLIELWNQVQHDLQNQTRILEDVQVISVPPRFARSYLHEWEQGAAGDGAFQCLFNQGGFFAFCAHWEVQQNFGIAGDANTTGATFTHPWEAWHKAPSYPPKLPFPSNLGNIAGLYYDMEPIGWADRKQIERSDPSWRSREGEPVVYTRESIEENTFLPYPRPSTVVWNDEAGTGMVTSVSGDTTGAEVGVLTQRTGNLLSQDVGLGLEVLDADDNFLVLFDVAPSEAAGAGDEIDYPPYLSKYVRYGVLSHAYKANTDGAAPSLAGYWEQRYTLGVRAIQRLKWQRTADRNRRFVTEGPAGRRNYRHSRLPDGYPAVNP